MACAHKAQAEKSVHEDLGNADKMLNLRCEDNANKRSFLEVASSEA